MGEREGRGRAEPCAAGGRGKESGRKETPCGRAPGADRKGERTAYQRAVHGPILRYLHLYRHTGRPDGVQPPQGLSGVRKMVFRPMGESRFPVYLDGRNLSKPVRQFFGPVWRFSDCGARSGYHHLWSCGRWDRHRRRSPGPLDCVKSTGDPGGI